MFSSLLKILTSRLFWGFIGITLIALIIWLAGPLLAFNDYRPLETEFSRGIIIAVIYGIWILCKLIPKLYSLWFNSKLLNHLSAAQQIENEPKSTSTEDDVLKPRFTEALELLKKARLSRTDGNKPHWYERFSNQYIYQLPWYVIIGAPGAGKTTALVNSGLHFPLAEQYGKAALRGVGGTRNCDWWFTNEAVLLDTAGRYTTQESQREEDASEWRSFVKLLKTFRSRQPINGVIVTISVSDLLTYKPEERTVQAIALRKRLAELYKEFDIFFPVYVLVTKSDLLTGFMPYFDSYDKELRSQLWGFTFPYSETQQSGFNLLSAFDKEYDLLQQRIDSALMDMMQREIDLKKRADIYQFPQQFGLLKSVLRQYLEDVFPSSAYEKSLSPRGVYLTSGTQEGTTFGKVLGNMRDELNIPSNEPSSQFVFSKSGDSQAIPEAKGQSYFIKDLLQNVLFREAGLAGNNRWWEYRNRALHWAGYIALVTITIISTAFWFNSYSNNSKYIAQVNTKINPLEIQGSNLKELKPSDILSLLPYLNSLINLPTSRDFNVDDPSFNYQFGLYRGNQVKNASNGLYQKALKELLLPQVARQTRSILYQDSFNDPDFTHEALKAYLMLYKIKHYDGTFLQNWIMVNLRKTLSSEVTVVQREQIRIHLHNLLELQNQSSPFVQNDKLIERAQIYLNKTPLEVRVYSRLKRISLEQATLHEITLSELAGKQASTVFKRNSGKPLTTGVSGLFTTKGYWNVFDKNFNEITDTLHNESAWVLNSVNTRESSTQLHDGVRKLYVDDFIAAWTEFLNDIRLVDSPSLEQDIRIARLLSGPDSPMRTLAISLAGATSLKSTSNKVLGTGTGRTLMNTIQSRVSSRNPTLANIYNSEKDLLDRKGVSPEEQVELVFSALHQLGELNKESNKIPFDANLILVTELYAHLNVIESADRIKVSPPKSEIANSLKADAGRLPSPFDMMFMELSKRTLLRTGQIDNDILTTVLESEVNSFCRQAVGRRYPLWPSATQEITPDDLAAVFAPQTGSMDRFFQKHLQGRVNTSTSVWRSPKGADGNPILSTRAMTSFQQAADIRSALFAGGSNRPSFKLTVKPVRMDSEILNMTLDINGQVVRYSHGPLVPVIIEWPGNKNSNQVHLQYSLVNGSSSSSVTSGFWALHKMIKQATSASVLNSNVILVTFTLDGRKATIELTPHSAVSPFKLPSFSCP